MLTLYDSSNPGATEVNKDADFIHSAKCLKKLKTATDKLKTCFLCNKSLKKAPKKRKSGESTAKTVRFPTGCLSYITEEETRLNITEETKFHVMCLEELKETNAK